jgi:iron(III) transport system ATP-binding protein
LVAQFSSNYLDGRPIEIGSRVRIGLPKERLHPMQEAA